MNDLGGRAAARIIVLAALLISDGAHRAWADFADGLAAFDAGDDQGALEAWRPLAEAGDAEAQIALAGLYQGQGEAVAQLNLGDLYSRGTGVPRDLVQAHLWLSLAAAQGRRWASWRRQQIAAAMTAPERAEAKRLAEAWHPAE